MSAVILPTMSAVAAEPIPNSASVASALMDWPRDGTVECDTSGKSPGSSNVALAADELRRKGGSCGKNGGTEQMVHGSKC